MLTAPRRPAVRRVDGTISAECSACSLCLRLSAGADPHAAATAFRAAHPDAPHRRRTVPPAGWTSAWSWPGALSQ